MGASEETDSTRNILFRNPLTGYRYIFDAHEIMEHKQIQIIPVGTGYLPPWFYPALLRQHIIGIAPNAYPIGTLFLSYKAPVLFVTSSGSQDKRSWKSILSIKCVILPRLLPAIFNKIEQGPPIFLSR